ncbi:CPBP family intramembrane metalloprotease [Paenisporosarcina cavernae]|uniref:CPBP family intramembrane metalloprotease n=1 Tax=Paenisporosarcina cavernae TaxID=2320858 RepID=A0A385YVG6_9BACL|nr:CPBP family intramembrane metalloprotease [Paenisporosarcina cavernae]
MGYAIGIFLYLLIFGQLTSISGSLFEYQDYLFLVLGIIFLMSVFFIPKVRGNLSNHLKKSDVWNVKNLVVSFGSLVVMMVVYKEIIFLDPFAKESVKTALRFNLSTDYSPVLFVAMIIIAPLWEEFFFRGMLIGGLRQKLPVWICVILSATLFAFLHPLYPLFGFTLAILYTILFFATKSLWITVIVHSAWNIFIVLTNYL